MFKVIKDHIPQPMFFVMCDRSCGTYVHTPVQPGPSEDAQQAMWARALINQGWRVQLHEHVCPAHVQEESGNKSLIVLPSGMAASALRN